MHTQTKCVKTHSGGRLQGEMPPTHTRSLCAHCFHTQHSHSTVHRHRPPYIWWTGAWMFSTWTLLRNTWKSHHKRGIRLQSFSHNLIQQFIYFFSPSHLANFRRLFSFEALCAPHIQHVQFALPASRTSAAVWHKFKSMFSETHFHGR